MHIAPVVLISHAAGPDGWIPAFRTLADCLERHPHLAVTVRAPGAALEHVSREEKALWGELDRDRIQWLAGGFSDPVLTALPPDAAALQLEREAVAMDAAGVAPAGLWVGDVWEPGLVSLAADLGLSYAFVSASLLDPVPFRPGPVERAGEAVMVAAVARTVPQGWPDDALAAVECGPDELEEMLSRLRGRIVTPDAYLASHAPGSGVEPRVVSATLPPQREAFYRELLVLTRDHAQRRPGRDGVLRLHSREHLLGEDTEEADRLLLDARRALDRSRHRGDTWVELRSLDWDADGLDEVWIGTADYTLVVDPPDGSVRLWQDRSSPWTVTAVSPPWPIHLMRRLTIDGHEPALPRMAVEASTQGKSHASLTLTVPSAGTCRVEVSGRTVTVELTLAPGDPVRAGPEIPLALGRSRVRADGGAWQDVDDALAVNGHRFRITDGDHTVLVSSPRPCELFVRPLAGRGMVIWPHWLVREGGTYRLDITPS